MTDTTAQSTSTTWCKAVPLLILAGMCAYSDSFDKAFVLDDTGWITGKWDLNDSLGYLRAMTNRPLIGLSILLNYRLGGLHVSGYHAVNLAIHILAALTLFGILRRTLLLERWQGRFAQSAPWLALTIALWWVVHPLTTQAVTYIIQRCESMMGLFYLLALYCVIRAHTAPRPRWWYIGAVAAGVCSAGAKEVAATIPLVILVYDWMFLVGSFRQLVKERWGLYGGLTLVWMTNALCMALSPKAAADMNMGFGFGGVTPKQYLLTEAGVIPYYLRLCFWPWPLCAIYRGWPIAQSLREVLLPGSLVLALLLLTAWAVARRWWPGFLGAWFFFILAPTSSFVPIIDVAFEHRMYLPLIAVLTLVVLAGHALLRRLCVSEMRRGVLAAVLTAGVALVLGSLTFCRNLDYRSEITLWRDALQHYPSGFARLSLGSALAKQGQADEALPLLRQAYYEDHDWLALFFIGQIYTNKGELERARRYFTLALEANPKHGPSHHDLGLTLYYLGKPREAAEHLRTAVQLEPGVALNHQNLAVVLDALGERDEADAEYRRALRLDPGFPARDNRRAREVLLGESLDQGSLRQDALLLATKACRATGDRKPEMLDTLAMAYAANGHFDDAVATVRKGIKITEEANDALWQAVLAERLNLYERHEMLRHGQNQSRSAAG